MARSALPTFPLVIFGIVEPLLLLWAYILGIQSPQKYFSDQVPHHTITQESFPPQALGLTLQMANVMLLLAALGFACSFTRDAFTAKVFLFSVALADWGHIYASYRALGDVFFWDYTGWNDMVAGNIGASVVLNVLRWLTLAGAFGRIESAGGLGGGNAAKKRV